MKRAYTIGARMTTGVRARRLLLLCLTGTLGLSSAKAAAPGHDPWSTVPVFPTGCYTNDGFHERVQAAIDAMAADIDKQEAINASIGEKYSSIDISELQSRMMTYLSEHPEDAMKAVQAMQMAGQQVPAEFQRAEENKKKVVAEYDPIKAQYNESIAESSRSTIEMLRALGDGEGARSPGPKEIAAIERSNLEYKRICEGYFGAAGPARAWLKKYREQLVSETIPASEGFDKQKVDVYSMAGVAAADFRSTASMKSVREYMGHVLAVFNERWEKPWTATSNPVIRLD